MSADEMIRSHLAEHRSVLDLVSAGMSREIGLLAELALDTLTRGGKLLLCGNGGSAADAQHLAAEYVVRFDRQRPPVAALALTTDTSILTAGSNDYGFEAVFERQVRALAKEGDLLLMHSTSGESENLVRAAAAAREMGVATAALLAKGGGRLAGMVDVGLVVPTDSTARAQELHLTIGHIVCDYVESRITETSAKEGPSQ
jgi:D-sedoheptulose 7-phosphate isomerase